MFSTTSAPALRAMLKCVVAEIGRNDQIGAGPARRENGKNADRPAAGDQHGLAEHLAAAAGGMQRHRQWFRHGGFPRRQPIRRHALAGIGHENLAECPLNMRERHGRAIEAHVEALVEHGLAAVFAGMAGARWRNADQLPDLQAFDTFTQLR